MLLCTCFYTIFSQHTLLYFAVVDVIIKNANRKENAQANNKRSDMSPLPSARRSQYWNRLTNILINNPSHRSNVQIKIHCSWLSYKAIHNTKLTRTTAFERSAVISMRVEVKVLFTACKSSPLAVMLCIIQKQNKKTKIQRH